MEQAVAGRGCGSQSCVCGRARFAAGAAMFMWAAAVIVQWPVALRYEGIFRDFGAALPTLTRSVLRGANWIAGANVGQTVPGAVFVLPVVISMLVMFGVLGCSRNAGAKTVLWLFASLGALFAAAELASLLVPYFSISRSL